MTEILGTCDWGGCDAPAVGYRMDLPAHGWLPVCRDHIDVTLMRGVRVPDGTLPPDYAPGNYGKRGETWWVCLPTGVLGRLDERWTTIEHDDGTATLGDRPGSNLPGEPGWDTFRGGPSITVSPSLWHSPQGWHGWLDHGIWRSVDLSPEAAAAAQQATASVGTEGQDA